MIAVAQAGCKLAQKYASSNGPLHLFEHENMPINAMGACQQLNCRAWQKSCREWCHVASAAFLWTQKATCRDITWPDDQPRGSGDNAPYSPEHGTLFYYFILGEGTGVRPYARAFLDTIRSSSHLA